MRLSGFKSLLAPDWLGGHSLNLLIGGEKYFADLIEVFDHAHTSIYIETYIFCPQGSVLDLIDAILRASKRGVKVFILVDGFGSAAFLPVLISHFNHPNVELQIFRPNKSWRFWTRQSLRRLHRKLVVIDESIAWVGGVNFLDDWFDPNHGVLENPRLDYSVRLQGSVCQKILLAMQRQRLQLGWFNQSARKKWRAIKKRWKTNDLVYSSKPIQVQFLLRDNLYFRNTIENAYLHEINNAQSEIWIANAYFFPGERMRLALIHAAKRGVSVNLLLQGKMEYRIALYAAQALYQGLLEHGVNIVEYNTGFLHAKVAVIDGVWATVGSSNLDPFSLLLAREANIAVRDASFAHVLLLDLRKAASQGRVVELVHLKKQSWWQRIFYWAVLILCRFGFAFSRRLSGLARDSQES